MIKKHFLIVCFLFQFGFAHSQSADSTEKDLVTIIEKYFPSDLRGDPSSIMKNMLNDPNTLNMVLKSNLVPKNLSKIITDLNFEFKNFENSTSNQNGLGFTYQYDKNIPISNWNKTNIGGAISLKADGNVAFQSRLNPANFLNDQVSIHLFDHKGGLVRTNDSAYIKAQRLRAKIMSKYTDLNLLLSSNELKAFNKAITNSLTNQIYGDLSLNAGLESNQLFTKKNWTFGSEFALNVNFWDKKHHWNAVNIFDYPFAIIRFLTATDQQISVDGGSFPTVIVGIDYVKPYADSIREVYGDSISYMRIKAEIGFKTKVAKFGSQVVNFVSNYKVYSELNPTAALQKSGYNKFGYFVAALQSSSGFFVSYSIGKLPFDAVNSKVYSLGFQYKF